ncbi:MAG: hypothetical protein ACLUVD_11380 [Mediterraneibacter faecis]
MADPDDFGGDEWAEEPGDVLAQRSHYDAHGNRSRGRSSSRFFGSKNRYDDHGKKIAVNLLLINN